MNRYINAEHFLSENHNACMKIASFINEQQIVPYCITSAHIANFFFSSHTKPNNSLDIDPSVDYLDFLAEQNVHSDHEDSDYEDE